MDDEAIPPKKLVDDEVLEILKDSLRKKIKNERRVNTKTGLNSALRGTLEEFLECGRLMGYDFEGNEIEIVFFETDIEESAMSNLFIKKFGEFMGDKLEGGYDIQK